MVFCGRRRGPSSSFAYSSRLRGEASSAWSAAIRFSSSSRGSSKSSASGILHRDRASAQERLDLGADLLTRVDGHSAAADNDLLRPENEAKEQRAASRMHGAVMTQPG